MNKTHLRDFPHWVQVIIDLVIFARILNMKITTHDAVGYITSWMYTCQDEAFNWRYFAFEINYHLCGHVMVMVPPSSIPTSSRQPRRAQSMDVRRYIKMCLHYPQNEVYLTWKRRSNCASGNKLCLNAPFRHEEEKCFDCNKVGKWIRQMDNARNMLPFRCFLR